MSRSPADRQVQKEMERRRKELEKSQRPPKRWETKEDKRMRKEHEKGLFPNNTADTPNGSRKESFYGIDRGVCEYDPRANPHPSCRCAIHAWTQQYQNPDYRWYHGFIVPTFPTDPIGYFAPKGGRSVSHELRVTGVRSDSLLPDRVESLYCDNCRLAISSRGLLDPRKNSWSTPDVWFGFPRPSARSPESSAELDAHRSFDLQTQRFHTTRRVIVSETTNSRVYSKKPKQFEQEPDWCQSLGWCLFNVCALAAVLADKDARDHWWNAMSVWLDQWEVTYG